MKINFLILILAVLSIAQNSFKIDFDKNKELIEILNKLNDVKNYEDEKKISLELIKFLNKNRNYEFFIEHFNESKKINTYKSATHIQISIFLNKDNKYIQVKKVMYKLKISGDSSNFTIDL